MWYSNLRVCEVDMDKINEKSEISENKVYLA